MIVLGRLVESGRQIAEALAARPDDKQPCRPDVARTVTSSRYMHSAMSGGVRKALPASPPAGRGTKGLFNAVRPSPKSRLRPDSSACYCQTYQWRWHLTESSQKRLLVGSSTCRTVDVVPHRSRWGGCRSCSTSGRRTPS